MVEEKSELRKGILNQEHDGIILCTRQGIKKSMLIKPCETWTHRIGFLVVRYKCFY